MILKYTIDKYELLQCAMGTGNIRVRAWDSSNNTQPESLTWNLMVSPFRLRYSQLSKFCITVLTTLNALNLFDVNRGWEILVSFVSRFDRLPTEMQNHLLRWSSFTLQFQACPLQGG